MDLENVFDRIDKDAMWQVLKVYRLGGKLLRAVESLFKKGKTCVSVGKEEGKYFSLKVVLRLGCVMSLWLLREWCSEGGESQGE